MLSNKASEIMTRDVLTAEASQIVFAVMELMAEKNVGAVVITEKNLPVGIFTEQDVLKRVVTQKRDAGKISVKSVMTTPIRAVREDTHVVEALGKMYRGKFRHLLIRSGKGKMAGLVSVRDILKFAVEVGQGLSESRTIGELVSDGIVSVAASDSIERTVELMGGKNSACVIVLQGESPKGIFTERDVLKRVAIKKLNLQKTPVKDVMTDNMVTMPRNALIGEVLMEMHQRGFRNMPIRDEGGKLVGVVALPEILQYARGLDVDETIRKNWKEVEEFWESEEHYTPG